MIKSITHFNTANFPPGMWGVPGHHFAVFSRRGWLASAGG